MAELLVADSDDSDVDNVGMVRKCIFDLARKHVLSPGDDHLVVAPVDEQPAGPIEMADVAGGHQPPDRFLRATTGVTLEGKPVADEDPPRHARGSLVLVVDENFDDAPASEGLWSAARPPTTGSQQQSSPRHDLTPCQIATAAMPSPIAGSNHQQPGQNASTARPTSTAAACAPHR